MNPKIRSVLYRGLTTVSKKTIKILIILVFLTGSRATSSRDDNRKPIHARMT
ncbi:hypothetical protein [Rickettsia asembonensis]|uniref:hypothetical protein n=1 Tax=Rickettsia asembonensis TaxID=1068590 RepID=UPI001F515CF0|nr:hypothetical protein [Rickettsia asembonensis]